MAAAVSSADGGLWVMPERSMKELVWSETLANGGGKITLAVPQPTVPASSRQSVTNHAAPVPTLPQIGLA